MTPEKLCQVMEALTGRKCKVSKNVEVTYVVDVFNVPQEEKDRLRDLIHEAVMILESMTGDDINAAAVVRTVEETTRYHPEMKDALASPQPPSSQELAEAVRRYIELEKKEGFLK